MTTPTSPADFGGYEIVRAEYKGDEYVVCRSCGRTDYLHEIDCPVVSICAWCGEGSDEELGSVTMIAVESFPEPFHKDCADTYADRSAR